MTVVPFWPCRRDFLRLIAAGSAGVCVSGLALGGKLPLSQSRHRSKAGANAKTRNSYGSSPLAEAAVTGKVAVIERLLKAGADPESANADGETALILARTSNVEAAGLLMAHGADVNAVEKFRGQTGLCGLPRKVSP